VQSRQQCCSSLARRCCPCILRLRRWGRRMGPRDDWWRLSPGCTIRHRFFSLGRSSRACTPINSAQQPPRRNGKRRGCSAQLRAKSGSAGIVLRAQRPPISLCACSSTRTTATKRPVRFVSTHTTATKRPVRFVSTHTTATKRPVRFLIAVKWGFPPRFFTQ